MVFDSAALARHSDQPKSEPPQQYVYEVRGASTSAPSQDRSWSQFYETEDAARVQLKKIQQEYAKGGIHEFDKNKPVGLRVERIERAAVDVAKRLKEVKDTMEGKPGAVLKEYSDRIKKRLSLYENGVPYRIGAASAADPYPDLR